MAREQRQIKQITVTEFFEHPDSSAILEGYSKECRISGLPIPNPDVAMYQLLESSGMFTIYGAFDGDRMVGFLVILVSKSPHYSTLIGSIESIYVLNEERSNGHGISLIRTAKSHCKDAGASGMLISTPTDGVFSKVMTSLGAKKTNDVYFWGICNE